MDEPEVFAKYLIQCMRVNTLTIRFMGRAIKSGSRITLSILVTTFKVCEKVKASLDMAMEILMKEVGWKISCMDKENTCGLLKDEKWKGNGISVRELVSTCTRIPRGEKSIFIALMESLRGRLSSCPRTELYAFTIYSYDCVCLYL